MIQADEMDQCDIPRHSFFEEDCNDCKEQSVHLVTLEKANQSEICPQAEISCHHGFNWTTQADVIWTAPLGKKQVTVIT